MKYVNIFSKEAAMELFEYTKINDHPINLEESK